MKSNAKIEAAKKAAVKRCDELLVACQLGVISKVEEAEKNAEKALEAVNTELHHAFFEEWYATENPMDAAMKQLFVENARIATKYNNKTGEVISVKLEEATPSIFDLDEVQVWAQKNGKKSLTYGTGFMKAVDKSAGFCALRAHYDMSAEKKFDKSREFIASKGYSLDGDFFGIANGADLTSNKTLAKVLQGILDELIFIPDEKKPELNSVKVRANVDGNFFLHAAYTWNKKTARLSMPRPETITPLMLCIGHHILTGESYEVLFDYLKRK